MRRPAVSPAMARAKASRAPRPPRRRRGVLRTILIVIVGFVAVLAIAWAVGWYVVFLKPQVQIERGIPVQLEVPKGATTRAIGEQLAAKGVIANANMFRLTARQEGSDGKLRPGVYDLATGMDYQDVIARLEQGPPIEYKTVTIPEGFTVEQIAARMDKQADIPAKEFRMLALTRAGEFDKPFLGSNKTDSLEGYLFPKTYRIREDATAKDVINQMLDQFGKETADLDYAGADRRNLNMHDVVTIASMIEREAMVAKERKLVSSVIMNRLKKHMRLEIDATIEYVLPGTRPRLLNRHLRIDSPYNTYRREGLPPGPIASPGLASMKAALDPADTDYIYYVRTGKDGSHTFTESWQEFLRAKERSREVVR